MDIGCYQINTMDIGAYMFTAAAPATGKGSFMTLLGVQ